MKFRRSLSYIIVLLIVCMAAGCSESNTENLKEKVVTDKPVIIPATEADKDRIAAGDDAENSSSKSDTENGDKNSTENGNSNGSTENGGSNEADTPDITEEPVVTEEPEAEVDVISKLENIRKKLIDNADYYNSLDNTSDETWCFQRKKDHSPSGTYEYFKIADYNGFYLNTNVTDDDKVIYLTFDCGYPSDLTVKILDTLKKHNAKASFFVTKMYLEECADYAIRMKKEGHAVCNHTVSHLDLRDKSVEKIASEIIDVAEYYYQVTGYEFDPYFRTPTGAYTKRLMTIIKDAGYKTVFWSIAYGDYDEKNQPEPGYVTNHFRTYHHNGAVALMHNDSTSNANELDAVLTLLEEEGYRFGALSEIQ